MDTILKWCQILESIDYYIPLVANYKKEITCVQKQTPVVHI